MAVAWLEWLGAATLALAAPQDPPAAPPGNRLAYLDESDPYYVSGAFPRLATPQWIGEEGVEAALVFSIDDMRDPAKYEAFLRPLLDRLKKIDGRAPVSIMSNVVDPAHARLQSWLGEGLSLENHTWSHPHPLLRDGDFVKARSEVDRMTDLLFDIPGNRPVAFRTPWCDVLNTVSPRFFAEIFNGTTGKGRFLTIDSSIFTILAPRERTAKYLAHVPNFVNLVEDYPYPYVIGRLCWEFPAVVPDDSVAQRLNKPNSPETVRDLQATIDAVVEKQGTWTLVFHPHNWIRNDQLVDLVDHAVARHGRKAKFLTFREAQERIDRHLLDGHPLRAADGSDNGVRLLDLDADGFLDVVIGNEKARKTRLWRPAERRWEETGFPAAIAEGVRFGIVGGHVVALLRNERRSGAWRFEGRAWVEDAALLAGIEIDGKPVLTLEGGRDRGVRLRDATNDGSCELLVGNEGQGAVFGWSATDRTWKRQSWSLPKGTAIVDAEGRDAGLRFADLNGDRHEDIVFSNAEGYSVHLFIPRPNALRAFPQMGWTRPAAIGRRGDPGEVPAIVRGGPQRTNGAWFHSGRLWVQNEDTTKLPDHCDRRTFRELMVGHLPAPISPEESMNRIRLRPGFRIELVAAEPLVHDLVSFEWGPDGKLWVVEMLDYPLGLDGKGRPGGRVRFLEDTDGDGRYDRSTVFLEGLSFPTGVMPWRKGVLVSAAPEILYAEDTDGDGRADVRKVLLSGFGLGNQQHRVNGFQYGLDNWVYGANGGSGGTVRSVSIQGRDFRFHPDTGAFEPAAGLTEFGRHRDDWGNWFGNNHPTWGWHYWLPEHYLPRNPRLAVRGNRRVFGDLDLTFRVSPLMARPQMARRLDHVTAPCGVMPYRDDLFGPGFESSVFIGEVDKNLVRRFVLSPDGVTFTGRRAADEQDREFLASTDNWFRPTMTKTGPDGALYIADMYRLIIEHQEYYPRDTHDLMDFRAGSDRGRLYRVVPEGATLRPIPRLDRMSPVAAMESPNGWQRDTAQRLLVHAQDKSAIDPLRKLARESARPKVRLQALCTLEGLDGLDAGLIAAALGDAHAAVREHAVRLCEPFLRKGGVAEELAAALLSMAEDPEARVRFQLAFTLGEWKDPRAAGALAALGAGDEAMRIATLSSAVPHAGEMLIALFARGEPPAALLEPLLGLVDGDALDRALGAIVRPAADGSYAPWQYSALAALLDARPKSDAAAVLAHARKVVVDPAAPVGVRVAATALLARGREEDVGQLADLLDARTPEPVQRAALERLSKLGGPAVAEALLARWRQMGPSVRDRSLDLLLGRDAWVGPLLAALERGAPSPGELDPARQQRLRTHADPKVRERGAKLLSAVNADREKVLQGYRAVEGLRGDAARGHAQFVRSCASCHRFKDEGHAVGPDLGQAASKSVQDLMVAILDPSRNIAGGYAAYRVVTTDDRDLSGVIAAETANSVTLRMANGVEEAIRRDRIRLLAASTLSLMPDGMEKALTPQDLADLFEFLRKEN